MKGKKKLIALIFITIFLVSCENVFWKKYEYQFINETNYFVAVTLNKEYVISQEQNDYPLSEPIELRSNSSQTVFINSGSIDFSWVASSGYYYSSSSNDEASFFVYPVKGSGKVTFKERPRDE